MIRSRRGLIVIAAVTCLVTLIATFPARVAFRALTIPGVQVAGIEGTIWSGLAREVLVNDLYLRDVQWDVVASQFLRGRLAYRIDAEPPGGFARCQLAVSTAGHVQIRDLQASLAAASLEPLMAMQGLQGTLNLDFENLELHDGFPVAARGVARAANLVVPLVTRERLGGYQAEFTTQNSGVRASLEDTDGVVDLAASLQLNADRSWQLNGLVIAKPNTPERLRNEMRLLGPANDRGQQEIRLEGRF